jgi:hypothetical protein
MYSDWDSTTSSVLSQSSYRLEALQQPSLIFDTYNYIHILSDPDASVNGGSYGLGLNSDFEFRIDTVTADSISLTGRFHGSKLSLRKATQADKAVWQNKQVQSGVVAFKNFWKFLLYFKRLTYAGTQYELQFDTTVKKVTVSWGSGVNTQSVTRGYYFWNNGVYFSDPIINGAANIPGFSITGFSAPSQVMNVTVNGTAATISGFSTPINPDDKNAANRWWLYGENSDYYWISFSGFHVNGVDDAYNLGSLKTDSSAYYFMLYKPNTNAIDAYFSIFADTVHSALDVFSGSWATMNISTSTGIAKFNEYGIQTAWPTTGPLASTRSQLFNTSGYYFVQSSAYSYDMVSVADAKTWISWVWLF